MNTDSSSYNYLNIHLTNKALHAFLMLETIDLTDETFRMIQAILPYLFGYWLSANSVYITLHLLIFVCFNRHKVAGQFPGHCPLSLTTAL